MNDYRDNFENNNGDAPQQENFGYHYGSNFTMTDSEPQSASWDNKHGYREPRRKRAKKTARPITFTRKTLALLIALCVLVSGGVGFGSAAAGNLLFGDAGTPGSVKTGKASATGYTLENATGSNLTVQQITEAAKSSVVEIKTESVTSDAWMQQYVTQGAGSGVIISKDGYIVTNCIYFKK